MWEGCRCDYVAEGCRRGLSVAEVKQGSWGGCAALVGLRSQGLQCLRQAAVVCRLKTTSFVVLWSWCWQKTLEEGIREINCRGNLEERREIQKDPMTFFLTIFDSNSWRRHMIGSVGIWTSGKLKRWYEGWLLGGCLKLDIDRACFVFLMNQNKIWGSYGNRISPIKANEKLHGRIVNGREDASVLKKFRRGRDINLEEDFA